jgi:tRNA (guanine-N7-)-methyltransferase
MTDRVFHRPIRSYVRREGRMTEAQRRALTELLPRYGIAAEGEGPLDFATIFGRRAPVALEIGFGAGEALAAMARAQPERDFLGIEVYRPGVGRLLQRLAAENLHNVRVMIADAKEVLSARIPDESLAAVYLFFPDPWPKKRHHKRRLVQPDFAALLCRRLAPRGLIHAATDWEDYAAQMLEVFSRTPGLENAAGPGRCYAERPPERPLTRFERRGQALGHRVYDLLFRKVATTS